MRCGSDTGQTGRPGAGLSDQDKSEIVETAHALADAARAAILPHFRQTELAADNKLAAGFDPVTEADRAAERAMRDIVTRRRPHDAVLGEEYGTTPGSSGLTWVLDPIDGTRAFLSGATSWGVLIAVSDARGPVYGLIDQPYIGERYEGGLGRAGMTGPRGSDVLRTRRGRPLPEALLYSTYPEVGGAAETRAFRQVAAQVRMTRFGLDCYAYALLAAGHIDLVIEADLNAYDIQAPIAVIEAAGGVVTDWQGGPAHAGGCAIAAADPETHRAALTLLAEGLAG